MEGRDQIIMAGSGGQGVLKIGQMAAQAGLDEGREATWLPSYGAEMRGGTANCSVIISDMEIPYPMITEPDFCVVMNLPSFLKFEDRMRPGGAMLVNSSLVAQRARREDLRVFYVPADAVASAERMPAGANMVMLGAWAAVYGKLDPQTLLDVIARSFTGKKSDYAQINQRLFRKGMAYIAK
jgi:2-oxoglutarate ferredoxin oxidoreductase subunit gamma